MIRTLHLMAVLLLAVLCAWDARADGSRFNRCEVDEDLTAAEALPRLAEAFSAGAPARIVVMGSTSSMGRGASSPDKSYVRLLQAAITAVLPGRPVQIIDRSGERRTALMMRDRIATEIVPLAPALVIWETGTTDAIRHLDPTDFGDAIQDGITALHEAGIDVVLVTPMFNPNVQSLVNYEPFREIMVQVAGAHEVAVFRRGAVMRQLVENGNLTLDPGGNRADTARAVDGLNACVAKLLATMIGKSLRPN